VNTPEPDDWDWIERLTARVLRWGIVGIPTWLICLAALNEDLTGIPFALGFVIASVIATVVVVVDDVRRRKGPRTPLSRFGRMLFIWVAAFLILAVVIGASGRSGVAVMLVPFLGATFIAGLAELGREMVARTPRH
jgi:low temperature requirement protein LtrA